jgi:hypothetical protein
MQKGAESERARDLKHQVSVISVHITEKAVAIYHEKMPSKIINLQRMSQVRTSRQTLWECQCFVVCCLFFAAGPDVFSGSVPGRVEENPSRGVWALFCLSVPGL